MQNQRSGAVAPRKLLRLAPLILAGLAAAIFFGGILMDALKLLFGAGVACFLLSPLDRLLEKKLGRALAAACSLLIAAIALALLLYLLVPAFARQFRELLPRLPSALERLRALADELAAWVREQFPDLELPTLRELDLGALVQGLLGAAGTADGAAAGTDSFARSTLSYAGGLAGGVYRLSLMAVLSVFFLADRDRVLLRLELLIPSAARGPAVATGKSILRELKGYLRGQATIALAVGALSATALLLIGVRGALLMGVIVGILNMIPYFGPVIGAVPAVLMALTTGWQQAALTAGALILVQQIDGMVISPRVMSSVTGFSPGVVLVALYLGSRLGGIGGMVFAMPVLMAGRTLYRVFVQRHEKN